MALSWPERLRRLGDALRYYGAGLGVRSFSLNIFLWAQAIAFKVLVALLPVILLATGVFGLVLRQPDPFVTVATFLRGFLPDYQSVQLIDLLSQLQIVGARITVLGAAGVVIAVVTLFSTLRYVIGSTFGPQRFMRKTRLRNYLFDTRMAVQVLLLFVASFGLTLGFSNALNHGSAWLSTTGVDPTLLHRLTRFLARATTVYVVPYGLTLLMFVQLYYFLPSPKPPLRSAWFGAFIGAALFEVAKNGFTAWAVYLGSFARFFDQPDATGAAGGVLASFFGLILVLVFWVYVSGLTLLLGAVLAALHEQRHAPTHTARRRIGLRPWLATLRHQRARRAKPAPAADADP